MQTKEKIVWQNNSDLETYVYISTQAILKFVLGKKCKDNEEFKDLISKEQIWLSNKD